MQRLNSLTGPLAVDTVSPSGLKYTVMCLGFTHHAQARLAVDAIANKLHSLSEDESQPRELRNHRLITVAAPGADAGSPADIQREIRGNIYTITTDQQVEKDRPWVTYGVERIQRLDMTRQFLVCPLSADLSSVVDVRVLGGLRCE
jgi:hypothetical protein